METIILEASKSGNGLGRPLIIGEVLFDQLPDGRQILGGAPFNVAWNLNGFSRKPIFASAVGNDDLGNSIRARMSENGMCDSGLSTSTKPTGVVQVSFDAGEPSYQIVSDRSYDFIEFQPEILQQNQISLIYHGSLAWRSEVTRETIGQYRSALAGVPVFVDLNIRQPWFDRDWLNDLIGGISYLKLSWDELIHLSAKQLEVSNFSAPKKIAPSEKYEAVVAAAERLLDKYSIQNLLVTDGGEGAYWVTEHDARYQPAINVEGLVDTIGAGDAFSSAAIGGVLAGATPEKNLKNAANFAAKVCSLPGATTLDRSFYET